MTSMLVCLYLQSELFAGQQRSVASDIYVAQRQRRLVVSDNKSEFLSRLQSKVKVRLKVNTLISTKTTSSRKSVACKSFPFVVDEGVERIELHRPLNIRDYQKYVRLQSPTNTVNTSNNEHVDKDLKFSFKSNKGCKTTSLTPFLIFRQLLFRLFKFS